MKNRIKIVLAAIAVLSVSQVADAASSFRWNPGAGSLKDTNGVNMATNRATVLTFLSLDTNVNAVAVGGKLTLQSTYGDDVFYKAERNAGGAPGAGRYITNYMTETDDSMVGKYVYAIILDRSFDLWTNIDDVPKNGTINAGITGISQFPLGVVVSVAKTDTDPATAPSSFNGGNVQTTLNVIPEPASALLLVAGLGAAVAARRRMRGSRS